MKKTLEAIEAKEEEILEKVERPFHWIEQHWLPVAIIVLAVGGGIGAWQYHQYTTNVAISQAWADLYEVNTDPELFSNASARLGKLEEILSPDFAESVVPYVRLEIAKAHEELGESQAAVDAYGRLAEDRDLPEDHLVRKVASARRQAIQADLEWAKQHEGAAGPVEMASDLPTLEFVTTKGAFQVELFEDHTPNSVANLIELVESGWYDACKVHRVVAPENLGIVQFGRRFNLAADAGIPEEGPGYRIKAEIHPDLHHEKGTLAMARLTGYDTAGSQVFINTKDNRASWDGRYAVIGRVTEGMAVIEGMVQDEDSILRARVIRKRDHEYEVEKLPVLD